MPFGDGRGPVWAEHSEGRDYGYGRGRSFGGRRGAGRRPRGRCFEGRGTGRRAFRRGFDELDVERGYGRGFGRGLGAGYNYEAPINEKEALKREKDFLERELKDINDRLGE